MSTRSSTAPSTFRVPNPGISRREWLTHAGCGMGMIGLAAVEASAVPHQQPHFRPTAKHCIILYMSGGPSSIDTFDYKPSLRTYSGQKLPDSFRTNARVDRVLQNSRDTLLDVPWSWKAWGESGLWISELFAKTAEHADEMAVVRSMFTETANHAPAVYQLTTGSLRGDSPSLGSWLAYGLGSESRNLPDFVSLYDIAPSGGRAAWASRFLPHSTAGWTPPKNALSGDSASPRISDRKLLQQLNKMHADARSHDSRLEARIATFERAFRQQAASEAVFSLDQESATTASLYGLENKATAEFGRKCVQARRLVESGVRVVQLVHGMDRDGWDAHRDLKENHSRNANAVDQPIGALLTDLKQRGLLDETLVVWCSEFGRLPVGQTGGGRNHNPFAFTIWMAGGGVRGGQAIGMTDEFGFQAIHEAQSVGNLHATILASMGLDANRLVFHHSGRDHRLIGTEGAAEVIPGVL